MTPEKLVGQQLGPYKIESILGSGGMAVVYRARSNDTAVALKILFPPPSAGEEIRLRFEREARTITRLNHAGIVKVLDAGQIDGYAYIAMELIEGQTLAERMRAAPKTPFTEAEAADIAWQIADALYYAHSQGVAHRDVKPSNILLTPDNRALLTDFGVAQALDDPSLTRTGHTVGTPAYMSPEQAGGDEAVDGRADLYALGVVLYQMVTGRIPFQGSTPQVLHAHIYETPPPPSSITQISAAMESIILKAMAKDVSSRFQTGAAMARALAQIGDQTGTHAPLLAASAPGGPLSKSRFFWPILAAVVLLLAAGSWFFWPVDTSNDAVVIANSPTPTATATSTSSPTDTPTQPPTPETTRPAIEDNSEVTTPTPTATTPPTSTPSPTASPSAEPSPTPSATATETPLPTATSCPVPADDIFTELLAADENILLTQLGCPREEAITTAAARQPFEQGDMLWRADSNLIYVLEASNNSWDSTGDTWRDGDPEPAAEGVPNGLYQPVRGFGRVWRESQGAREALGWATAEEAGFEAVIQEFSSGIIWQNPEDNAFFILLNDGTYQIQ